MQINSICFPKKTVFIFALVMLTIMTLLADQSVSIGGHAGISILDGNYGISSNGLGISDTGRDYAGFKFLKCILFIRCVLNDRLTLDVRPQIETKGVDGTTGATPKFGVPLGDQRATKTTVGFNGFTRAAASYVLPTSTELSIGYLNTKFTWEYGNELFWEDEMNGSPFALSQWLGDFTDAGIEAVHYFDFGESSLPVYAYLLNGSKDEEINRTPVGMLAIEPQAGPVRFHLAAAGGVWDEKSEQAMFRSSAGMAVSFKKLHIRAEEAFGYWQKRIAGSPDAAMPHGGYLKLAYPFTKNLRGSLGASYVYQNFVNTYNPEPGEERCITVTPALQFFTSSSSRIIMQLDLCDWLQSPSEGTYRDRALKFGRGTLGWRLTF